MIQGFADDNPLAVSLDDFSIGDIIGSGGYGEIYKARQKSTGCSCAIKKIYKEKLEGKKLRRYLNEIAIMSRTNNLFLIQFVGFTLYPPYCIITEYMRNSSLDRYILSKRPPVILSGTELTQIAIGVAYGMASLHSLGIIHRDLKAGNVLLDKNFLPKVCDFGISRFEDLENGMTEKIGTPNYMAPELITSKKYDFKVDVYSYAMLLYEMSEGVRPFKGLTTNDIFNRVINYDTRPRFTDRTPYALQQLISRCWAREPEERPTFEEIYHTFAGGKVYFLGTDRSKIIDLLKLIEFDQRHKIKSSRQNIIHKSYEQSSSAPESDSYGSSGYEESYEESETESEYSSSHETEKEKPTRGPAKESDAAFFSRIFCDPKDPDFHDNLEKYSNEVSYMKFNEFFSPLYTLFYNKVEVIPIMKAAQTMMDRDIQFILFFNCINFFNMMPIRNKDEIDSAVECISFLFTEMPVEISSKHIPVINSLMKKRPKKMLVLHSFYVRSFDILADPYTLIDNLRNFEETFIKKSTGYLYVSILYYLLTCYNSFAENRNVESKMSIVKFLKATDALTLTTTYEAIANLGIELRSLKSPIKHLNDANLWNPVLSVLMRQKNIKCTKKLLELLLLRSHASPRPWIILLNIASSNEGAVFLLNHNSWMDEALRHPLEVAKLFLMIFLDPSRREECIRLTGFPIMLNALIDSGDQKMHGAATTIIRRAPQTMELLNILSASGVIKSYIKLTVESKNKKMYSNSLLLFDALSRVGYIKEYQEYADLLIELIGNPNHTKDAITVIVSMSFFPQMVEYFKEKKLNRYFMKLAKFDNYKEAANIMLYNMNQK